jgi:sialic acid synthase SpsE
MDNQMATEPDDMARLVQYCREARLALGQTNREVSPEELAQRKNMRRSLVYARDLTAGTVLSGDDITAKRPGTGFEPYTKTDFIGKTITKDVEGDTLVAADDFE